MNGAIITQSLLFSNGIWPEFDYARDFMTVMVISKSGEDRIKMKVLSSPKRFLQFDSISILFAAQNEYGNHDANSPILPQIDYYLHIQITVKKHPVLRVTICNVLLESGENSNSSEILCLYWLSASLTKVKSKQNALACPQHLLHYKSSIWEKLQTLKGK